MPAHTVRILSATILLRATPSLCSLGENEPTLKRARATSEGVFFLILRHGCSAIHCQQSAFLHALHVASGLGPLQLEQTTSPPPSAEDWRLSTPGCISSSCLSTCKGGSSSSSAPAANCCCSPLMFCFSWDQSDWRASIKKSRSAGLRLSASGKRCNAPPPAR